DTAKAVADADPQSAAARFMIGSIQASRGEWEAATRAFNQVLQIAPRSIEAYIQLSHIHLMNGFAMQALDEASRAITIAGNSVDAHLALTRVRIARNELAAARLELDALTKRFPK